jgi:hypothetical protein
VDYSVEQSAELLVCRGNRSTRKKPAPMTLVRRKSHKTCRGIETGSPQRVAGDEQSEIFHDPALKFSFTSTFKRFKLLFCEAKLVLMNRKITFFVAYFP